MAILRGFLAGKISGGSHNKMPGFDDLEQQHGINPRDQYQNAMEDQGMSGMGGGGLLDSMPNGTQISAQFTPNQTGMGYMRGMGGIDPNINSLSHVPSTGPDWGNAAYQGLMSFSPGYQKANALFNTGQNLVNGDFMGAADALTGGGASAIKGLGESLFGGGEAGALGNAAAEAGAGLSGAGAAGAAAESGGLIDFILSLL